MSDNWPEIERAAERIVQGDVVVVTGAGLSVASGVPDFRSSGGLWRRYAPVDYATIEAFRSDPARSWAFFNELRGLLANIQPNPGHDAIAKLCKLGLADAVITQNVDGLHQDAGCGPVIELHGDVRSLHCIWCGSSYGIDQVTPDPDGVPYCQCMRPLKPRVVLFGEAMPTEPLEMAHKIMTSAKTVLVIGTSGEVEPAASLPFIATQVGARIVEVNIRESRISPHADIILRGDAAKLLPRLVSKVQELL